VTRAGTLLLGTVSRDRYLATGEELPGGGVLNVAWHWARTGRPFSLLTRLGATDAGPALAFLERHAIDHPAASIVAPGRSSSIDIVIEADRQPYMDRFVPGVWADYRLTADEIGLLRGARRLHTVLVEGAIAELDRMATAGQLAGIEVAADFLGFRHYTVERFAATMANADIGFVGWPGDEADPVVAGLRSVAHDLGRLVVVTMGARAVHVFDGRPEARTGDAPGDMRRAVEAVPVAGTTLGCGDAFIAGFLDAYWGRGAEPGPRDVRAAVERGKMEGAAATRWTGPLPDDAYDRAPRLRPAGPAGCRPHPRRTA
jgi:sugar/nucleoside kinase (ribokinase family)